MTPEQFTVAGWLIIKILTIVGLSLYAIYAWIIVRQEQLMSKVLAASSESLLRILALLHLAAAIGIILLAFILI
jgi:uncharacterized membrane protein